MLIVRRYSVRRIAVISALALATFGPTGCGSDDSSSAASEEDRIKQMFNDWQDDFAAGKGPETCAKLTESGRDELLRYRNVSGYIERDATCEETVAAIVAQTREANVKQQPARALSVRINGNKAVAQVSDAGRPAVPVRLVKQNGEWKLPSAGFGPVAGPKDGG